MLHNNERPPYFYFNLRVYCLLFIHLNFICICFSLHPLFHSLCCGIMSALQFLSHRANLICTLCSKVMLLLCYIMHYAASSLVVVLRSFYCCAIIHYAASSFVVVLNLVCSNPFSLLIFLVIRSDNHI